MSHPSDDDAARLFEQVMADIERDRGPVAWLRERSTRTRAVILTLAALGLAMGGVVMMAGPARLVPRGPMAWVSVVGLALAMVTALFAMLRPRYLPAWSGSARKLLLGGLALAGLASVTMVSDGSLGPLGTSRCLIMGTGVGVVVFSLALLFDRNPKRAGAFRAMFAGTAAGLATQLVCPAHGLMHLIVGHFGLVVALGFVFTGVGVLLARRA